MALRLPNLNATLLPPAGHWETPDDVAAYAGGCMRALGLEAWSFAWDRAIRRLGCCRPAAHRVSLSLYFVLAYLEKDQEMIRRTILHELAHALCWEHTRTVGHGRIWHTCCEMLGIGDARACTRCEDFAPPERRNPQPRYALCHTETGEVFHYFRRLPKRTAARISEVYIRGRKAATLGKLTIRKLP